jgi:predicted DNA-binding protein
METTEDRDPDALEFQTSIRFPLDLLKRIDALGLAIREQTGFPTKRSSIIRMTVERGIDDLEREYSIPRS